MNHIQQLSQNSRLPTLEKEPPLILLQYIMWPMVGIASKWQKNMWLCFVKVMKTFNWRAFKIKVMALEIHSNSTSHVQFGSHLTFVSWVFVVNLTLDYFLAINLSSKLQMEDVSSLSKKFVQNLSNGILGIQFGLSLLFAFLSPKFKPLWDFNAQSGKTHLGSGFILPHFWEHECWNIFPTHSLSLVLNLAMSPRLRSQCN